MTKQLRRHPSNSYLHLHDEDIFRGIPLMTSCGPFITEYLERLYETTQLALSDHPWVFALRFDLRFPDGYLLRESTSAVISGFVDAMTVRVRLIRARSRRVNGTVHQTSVRWCWIKQIGEEGRLHYHFVLLLNRDAYHTVGRFDLGRESLYSRIQSAWANALAISAEDVVGLVHIPPNAEYHLSEDDPAEMHEYFHRVSYLCNSATEGYGSRCRTFSCSRD
jgi:hypothetical protein